MKALYTFSAGCVLAAGVAVASAGAVTLHMHNGGDPSSLDPHKISGTWENRVYNYVQRSIVRPVSPRRRGRVRSRFRR